MLKRLTKGKKVADNCPLLTSLQKYLPSQWNDRGTKVGVSKGVKQKYKQKAAKERNKNRYRQRGEEKRPKDKVLRSKSDKLLIQLTCSEHYVA